MYIHNQSNHPKLIRKSITPMICKRLDKLSSNSHIFEHSKKPYNQALTDSGHNLIQDTDSSQTTSKNRRNRGRKFLYFNPLFSNNVKAKLGKEFLKLVKFYFSKNCNLNKFFNKNTIKLSYSCLPNMKSIINAHNKKS